jgi:hypothetical protein
MTAPPPTGYSWPFDVGADPKIVLAGVTEGEAEDWQAAVQVSPDGGDTYTDLIIHARPVVLDADTTLIRIPVCGKYRLRTDTTLVTYVIYPIMMTHEPDTPFVNLNRPGPTGPTGAGVTGATGPTGGTGGGGITGATGPDMMPTPYNFGAAGDGVTDDTLAVQDWLNAIAGAAGYGKAGTFLISSQVLISGGTTIYGAGKNNCVFKSNPAVSDDFNMFANANWVFPGDTNYIDTDIAIYDCGFEGQESFPTYVNSGLIALLGVKGFKLKNCLMQHRRGNMFIAANVDDVTIDDNESYDWGTSENFVGPPGTFVGGCAYFFYSNCTYNVKVINNYLHDAQVGGGGGGGIWFQAAEIPPAITPAGHTTLIDNNIIKNVTEFAIHTGTQDSTVSNNEVENVRRIDVSGHGFEGHGFNLALTGNTIGVCDSSCIYVFTSINLVVTHNILYQSNQEGTVAAALVISTATAPGLPTNTGTLGAIISNNQISALDANGYAAIQFINITGDPLQLTSYVNCINNELGPASAWSVAPIIYDPGAPDVLAANCIIRDNNESVDTDTLTVQFLIPAGTFGPTPISGLGFRPRTIDWYAVMPSTGPECATSTGQSKYAMTWDIPLATVTAARAFTSSCISTTISATDCVTTISVHAVSILNDVGTPQCNVDLISLDSDGFTIDVAFVALVDVYVNAICYS